MLANSLLSILDVAPSDKAHAVAQDAEMWDRMQTIASVDYVTRIGAQAVKTYRHMVLISKPSTDEERTVDLVTDTDRFADVLRVVRSKYPGWHLVETWEAADEF